MSMDLERTVSDATHDQAEVLMAHRLAKRHNTGLRRRNGLRNFADVTPFEPTTAFGKVDPPPSRPRPNRG